MEKLKGMEYKSQTNPALAIVEIAAKVNEIMDILGKDNERVDSKRCTKVQAGGGKSRETGKG
jgi:uncharacterized protein YqgV (UPF0045/DUF77 family)